jgi:hypothetical protein
MTKAFEAVARYALSDVHTFGSRHLRRNALPLTGMPLA